jgi:hypothetical protein
MSAETRQTPPTLRDVTLYVASDYEGAHEVGDTNSGPAVDLFLKAAQLRPGNPWCAAYVNFCAQEAARRLAVASPLEDVPLQGYVQAYVDYGRAHGWVVPAAEARAGDLFALYFESEGRYAHIGFVTKVDARAQTFRTIEGNTTPNAATAAQDRNGGEVARKARAITPRVVFLRWTA